MKKTNRRIVIFGGGTFQPIRNHLSLCAPAFGTTAKKLHQIFTFTPYISMPDGSAGSMLLLTKMANSNSKLVTNEDVENCIDELLEDESIGTIVLNIAFCDYKVDEIDGVKSGWHADRLKTADGNIEVKLTPTQKIISKIRIKRPDIFLVGFKTTTNKTSQEQFLTALKMMKSTKCNLVLANDTVTRNNFIITPEETIYSETTDREVAIKELANMIIMRNNLTYNRTDFIKQKSIPIYSTPDSFQKVIQFLIENGGFIENNGNGFTPGHFCWKNSDKTFISSQRKANHNLVFEEGMTVVEIDNDSIIAKGERKASVGATSQWMLLKNNPSYDCIIHTHNPLKSESLIPKASQKEFQCGSIQCGLNSVNNIKDIMTFTKKYTSDMKAVYLDKHGANILFKSTDNFEDIISFINENIELGTKVQ